MNETTIWRRYDINIDIDNDNDNYNGNEHMTIGFI